MALREFYILFIMNMSFSLFINIIWVWTKNTATISKRKLVKLSICASTPSNPPSKSIKIFAGLSKNKGNHLTRVFCSTPLDRPPFPTKTPLRIRRGIVNEKVPQRCTNFRLRRVRSKNWFWKWNQSKVSHWKLLVDKTQERYFRSENIQIFNQLGQNKA